MILYPTSLWIALDVVTDSKNRNLLDAITNSIFRRKHETLRHVVCDDDIVQRSGTPLHTLYL